MQQGKLVISTVAVSHHWSSTGAINVNGGSLEYRLREMLGPILARAADGIVKEARRSAIRAYGAV